MTGLLTDQEVRRLAIDLLNAPTARDAQTRIGASDLGNQCDFCLALSIAGKKRTSDISAKTWLGRTWGTAGHKMIEDRQNTLAWFKARYPEAKAEEHVWIHEFRNYGWMGGSIDMLLPYQIVDPKSSTRYKSSLLEDYLQRQGAIRQGLEPRWEKQKRGNYKLVVDSHTVASLSEKDYLREMAGMGYKVNGYYGQQIPYLHALVRMGHPARTASLLFMNRDGTGFFDVPEGTDFENPVRKHDIWVYSFRYNADHAAMILDRAQFIIDRLADGAAMDDFDRHDLCWACGAEMEQEKRDLDVVATFGAAA